MPAVIRIAGWPRPEPCPVAGAYVAFFDPEGDDDGESIYRFTYEPGEAFHYASLEEATNAWRAIRTRDGLRPDGKPSRPLTAFTVSIFEIEDHK